MKIQTKNSISIFFFQNWSPLDLSSCKVDDTSAQLKQYMQTMLSKINNIHSKVNFTFEPMIDNQIPFLESLFCKKGNNLKVKVDKKSKTLVNSFTEVKMTVWLRVKSAYNLDSPRDKNLRTWGYQSLQKSNFIASARYFLYCHTWFNVINKRLQSSKQIDAKKVCDTAFYNQQLFNWWLRVKKCGTLTGII